MTGSKFYNKTYQGDVPKLTRFIYISFGAAVSVGHENEFCLMDNIQFYLSKKTS